MACRRGVPDFWIIFIQKPQRVLGLSSVDMGIQGLAAPAWDLAAGSKLVSLIVVSLHASC